MLFGRDPARAQIGALLDAARESRSGALVVRGEPGIGKTALLEDARERAEDMHVMAARGVESESELPFAALHQLVRPALHLLERLPAPQATALRGALGLADGAAHERFLVFAGCLSLLSEHAEGRPVLCLVDDAHWLDTASADALVFVARRLHAEGIAMLFGAREGDVRRFEAPDVPSLMLEGLDAEAAAALLAGSAGIEATPAVRDRLIEQTRGNALALVELPSVLTEAQLEGAEPLPEALPMTRQVESIFLERVRRLPEETQRALLVAATDDTENAALVIRAAQSLGASTQALDRAERAGLVVIHGRRLAFRHPLVRSAVYRAAASSLRRAAHRALAAELAGEDGALDRRAWHLAASALEQDEDVVRALEEAAGRARERGGYSEAARALERAAELAAAAAARGRLLVEAASAASRGGEDERAVALARQALPLAEEPLLRAEVAHVLGLAEIRRGRPLDGHAMLVEAAGRIGAAAPRRAGELLMLALQGASEAGEPEALGAACAMASTLAPSDDESGFLLNVASGIGAMVEGDSARGAQLLELALAWAASADDEQYILWAGAAAIWLGDDARLDALLRRAIALSRAHGTIGVLAEALGFRGAQLLMAQRLDAAASTAAEALQLARETRAENRTLLPLTLLAYVEALRGDEEATRRLAAEARELATAHGVATRVTNTVYALALLELSQGRWAEALERLDALAEVRPGFGDRWLVVMSAPDRIEAAVRAGRPDVARAALPVFEAWAADAAPDWARRRLESCRALLAGGDESTRHFEEALRIAHGARPFDLARIELLYGEHLRRERRRVDARVQLRAALEAFESFGAASWAERARAELRASGETARKRDPGALAQLTPQERQIAGLVAEGRSNKEVAALLFLSPRTIDAHLRSVFSKLEITSRTQLARLPLGDVEPEAVPAGA